MSEKNAPPLPSQLPGDFCVIACEKNAFDSTREYTLIVDDEDQSTWKLGSDVQRIMGVLRRYGIERMLFDAMDRAREFGMAQAIFADGRVVTIHQEYKKPEIDFSEFDDAGSNSKPIYPPPVV